MASRKQSAHPSRMFYNVGGAVFNLIKAIYSVDWKDNTRYYQEKEQNTNIDNIEKWLKDMQMERYFSIFIENGYDKFHLICEYLDEDELKDIGVNKRIHRKKILSETHKLRNKLRK